MDIKPEEITSVLKSKIENFEHDAQIEEIGPCASGGRWYCPRLWTEKYHVHGIGCISQ